MSAIGAGSDVAGPTDAATKLADAIDDFLGELEKKFKGISDEILTKRESLESLGAYFPPDMPRRQGASD